MCETMTLTLHPEAPPLTQSEDGVVRITGTRIPLERVIRAFLNGATPEQILLDYDTLSLPQVYGAVNYYLQHRDEVDAYLAAEEQASAAIRSFAERRFDSTGLRARLLARQTRP
jgi:uncharacterized protein (DUF433 family)